MNVENLFDLKNTSDLPDNMQTILNYKNELSKDLQNIVDLFEMKKELTTNEIMVALYRIHNVEIEKKLLSIRLNNLVSSNKVERIGRGVYAKRGVKE